jgi:hypothetical protein
MRNRLECRCKPPNTLLPNTLLSGVTYQTLCRWGNCVEWRCSECDANLAGFGPAGCRCGGYIRECFHPQMRALGVSVAVKPSIMRRRNKKHARVV